MSVNVGHVSQEKMEFLVESKPGILLSCQKTKLENMSMSVRVSVIAAWEGGCGIQGHEQNKVNNLKAVFTYLLGMLIYVVYKTPIHKNTSTMSYTFRVSDLSDIQHLHVKT